MTATANGKKIKALCRRAAFLRNRIEQNTAADLSFDKSELAALEWAIRILTAYVERNARPQGACTKG